MAKKPTIIQYFRTGLFTRRSALFAPLRVIGIQVMLLNDALIDGQDMELQDTYQLQRRPGFSRFCSTQLAAGEIINQFYSERNSVGTVFPLFDSNQRLASFSTSLISTLWTKASSKQSFVQMVGNQLYISNGTANGQKRYDTVAAALHGMGLPAPTVTPTITTASMPTAGTTFWQPSTTIGGGGPWLLLDPNGNIQKATTYVTGPQAPAWSLTVGAATNEVTPGTTAWTNCGPIATWSASTAFTLPIPGAGAIIIDSNGNLQQLTHAGTTGAAEPAWNIGLGNPTTDGTAQWTVVGNNGPQSVFVGYTYVYVYSTQSPVTNGGYYHCSSASPASTTTGPIFGIYNYTIQGQYSANTDVASVDIYRTSDGGSTFDYVTSIANVTGTGTWSYADSTLDYLLNTAVTVPLGTTLLSDPPPGQTGTHSPSADAISQLTWWNGRFWGASGSKVYFTAGPDITNGDSYACWPPANVFTFPGPVLGTTGTSAGLLVWLPDSVKMILGGPQTSTYYPADLMDNFGISSIDCVSKDGDTITVLTTQGQVFQLTTTSKTEISANIGDVVTTFPEASSYLTTHRNGLDNGIFLGNGSTTILRYGVNVGAWSPKYLPVGGIQALNSIETSVGNMTLCAGRATAAGYILGRNLSVWEDDSQLFSNCFVTIGSIVLSQPLEDLVPVYAIAGYFAAGGVIPTVSVLPNEINTTLGPGFSTLEEINDEPAYGAAPSQTIMAKQWNMYSMPTMNNSLLMHHLQVKVSFAQENFPSTIFGIALRHDKE